MSDQSKIFSLLQVAQSIKKTLEARYTSAFWVMAEMNKLNHYSHSGHCYPELVQKSDGKVVAQVSAMLWKPDFVRANARFISVLNEPLKDGIKILFLAKVTFDPAHGLSLRILEIDPAYTLGDLQREKQETLSRLKTESLDLVNKKLTFPLLPQRIAIISVESSKGYADFLNIISNNQWGYHFFHHLFPSILQGEKAVDGIIKQLKQIKKVRSHFDIVVIIRGGGGDVGLSCYNNYNLAREIATFPIPVLTGIGHATNETVAEMISHLNAITPTKLAVHLIQRVHDFDVPVQKATDTIASRAKRILSESQSRFKSEVKLMNSVLGNILERNNNSVNNLSKSLVRQSQFRFANERTTISGEQSQIRKLASKRLVDNNLLLGGYRIAIIKDLQSTFNKQTLELENAQKNIANMSPHNVLKRGYSITMHGSKLVKSTADVSDGDTLTTLLSDGSVTSIATSSKL